MLFPASYFFQGCRDGYEDRYEGTVKDAKRSDEAEAKECRQKKSGIITDSRKRDSQGQWTPGYIHHTMFYKMDWLKRGTNDTVW